MAIAQELFRSGVKFANQYKFLVGGLALILILSAGSRIWLLPSQFALIDDAGVAITIHEARNQLNSVADIEAVIHNPALRQYNSPKMKLLRKLDDAGLLKATFGTLSAFRDVLAVPLRWSYAPAQYLITPWLLKAGSSYQDTLIAGRIPSFLLSILALCALAYSAIRNTAREHPIPAFLTLAVAGFSLEFLIFSAHMSNYAAGVLASTLLTIIVPTIALAKPASLLKAALGLAVGAWALVLISYQILIFVPAILATIVIVALVRAQQSIVVAAQPFTKRTDKYRAAVAAILHIREVQFATLAGVFFAVLLVPTYILLISTVQPITWNSGPHNEFVFHWPSGMGGKIVYFFTFYIGNFGRMFAADVSPVIYSSSLYWFVNLALIALFGMGIASFLKSPRDSRAFVLGVFILFVMGLRFATTITGTMALSPTRHALIDLPLFALAIGEGAAWAGQKAFGLRLRAAFPLIASVVLGALWIANIPAFITARHDPFDEEMVASVVKQTNAGAIISYGFTQVPLLMPLVTQHVPVFDERNLNFPWLSRRQAENPTAVMFVSQLEPLTEIHRSALIAAVNKTLAPERRIAVCGTMADTLYRVEKPSSETMEIDPATDSGANNAFVYVFRTARYNGCS